MNSNKISTAVLSLVLLASAGAASAQNGKGNSGKTPSVPTLPGCSGSDISVAGASCLGFFSGNLNGNKSSLAQINQDLTPWKFSLSGQVSDQNKMLSGLSGNTINFGAQLYGDTIISIHYGVVTDISGNRGNNLTAFYRFDAGKGLGIDSFTTRYSSLSNATVLRTSLAPVSAVPEPETYAMLLAGLGMMGFVARRRKQK